MTTYTCLNCGADVGADEAEHVDGLLVDRLEGLRSAVSKDFGGLLETLRPWEYCTSCFLKLDEENPLQSMVATLLLDALTNAPMLFQWIEIPRGVPIGDER